MEYLLQQWNNKYNYENKRGKITSFIRSPISSTPLGSIRATSLPPVGDSFMNLETSSNLSGTNVYCSFERTNFVEISNIEFYYTKWKRSAGSVHKARGMFRVQLVLSDIT